MPYYFHAQLSQQLAGDSANRHPGRGLPGAGTLQDISNVPVTIFQNPGQVGMPGAGPGHHSLVHPGVLLRRHHLRPVGPVFIFNQYGYRATQSNTAPHAGQKTRHVGLNLHPGATAISALAAGQLRVNICGGKSQPGRQALDHSNQSRPVGLSSG
ncbi:MAG: hypothetical protein BWY71_01872 [Planctomycetes bacterium ADurb.Bin412]|nr:MAG: hypothetical protein BWY71_01872 [Planctomycetes bacterium ADurb.Bin412]